MRLPEKNISLKIKNRFFELEKVNKAFDALINKHHLKVNITNPISVAIDEILNNTIKYGYSDKREHEILVEIKLLKDKICLYIEDDALPFNPLEVKESDTTSQIEKRKIGGVGIHLVRNMLDNMKYEYKNDRNCLTLEKKL